MKLARPWMSVVGSGIVAVACNVAHADSVGPYYATPSWDQTMPAATRFVVLSNLNSQAVLDRETGLVWERSPSTTAVPAVLPPNEFSANYAAGRCITSKTGGRYGWRVPTIQELESLADDSQSPALPSGHPFVGVSGQYWTSTQTSAAFIAGGFYTVNFDTGGFPLGLNVTPPSFQTVKVWCVRAGSGAQIQ